MVTPAKPREVFFRFAYDSILSGVTPTASTTAAGYAPAYVSRPENWLLWLPGAAGVSTLTWDLGTAKAASTLCVAVHRLAETSGSISLAHSDDGSTWTNAVDGLSPKTDYPFWVDFNETTARYWRINTSSTPASPLGYVFLGTALTMERGHFLGFSPPGLNTDVETSKNTSRDGRLLGISIRDHGAMLDLSLDPLTDHWTRTEWAAFRLHAETGSYFIQWDSVDHPYEVAYCWPMSAVEIATYRSGIHLETSLKSRAMKAEYLPPGEDPPPLYLDADYLWDASEYVDTASTWTDSNRGAVLSTTAVGRAKGVKGGYDAVGRITSTLAESGAFVSNTEHFPPELTRIDAPFSAYGLIYLEGENGTKTADFPIFFNVGTATKSLEHVYNSAGLKFGTLVLPWDVTQWRVFGVSASLGSQTLRYHNDGDVTVAAPQWLWGQVQLHIGQKFSQCWWNKFVIYRGVAHTASEMAEIMDSLATSVGYAPGEIT